MITFVTKGGISALLAIGFAGVAFNLEPGWLRDCWWFMAGMNAGFALAALFHDRFYAKQQRKMRDEMNAMGNAIIRQMREMNEQHMNPLVPNLPRDEPPRLH